MAATKSIQAARQMSPREAAEYLRKNFPKEAQVAELQAMLAAGGRVTNLAHGIAIELGIAEDDELHEALVESLKMNPADLSVGYGGQVNRDVAQRSEFAGKGPMFSRMKEAAGEDTVTGADEKASE